MTASMLSRPPPAPGRTWRERLRTRMGGLCRLVRAANGAGVPF